MIKGHLHVVEAAKLAQPSVGKATLADSPDFRWLPLGNESINLRPDGGRTAICSWGFHLSVGGLIDSVEVDFTKSFCFFSLVRERFTLEVGQKVGIAVLFTEQMKPNKFTIAGCGEQEILITEDKIREIYGEPNQVNIYTGEITYVGASHIEYSFNSFTGCSGAVVFLLDQKQPESVQTCDFGHAVAIHSGSHPFLQNRNYGFVIRNHQGSRISCIKGSIPLPILLTKPHHYHVRLLDQRFCSHIVHFGTNLIPVRSLICHAQNDGSAIITIFMTCIWG
jgi:hypothetical protein